MFLSIYSCGKSADQVYEYLSLFLRDASIGQRDCIKVGIFTMVPAFMLPRIICSRRLQLNCAAEVTLRGALLP